MWIDHDLHIHTNLSLCAHDGSARVENYIRNAKMLGLKKIGFSDHMWDAAIAGASKDFYSVQDYDHVSRILPEIRRANQRENLRIYFGCEAEYDPVRRDIALTEETARKFEFILVPNSHTHMIMPKEYYKSPRAHAQFMMDAFMDIVKSPLAGFVTAVAHPFSAVCCPYDNRSLYGMITRSQYQEAFCAASEAGIAMELNIGSYKQMTVEEILAHPSMEMFACAKKCGCKFIFGSDAHSAILENGHGIWYRAYIISELLNLCREDLADIVR